MHVRIVVVAIGRSFVAVLIRVECGLAAAAVVAVAVVTVAVAACPDEPAQQDRSHLRLLTKG